MFSFCFVNRFSQGKYLAVEILNHMKSVCLVLEETYTLVSKAGALFYISASWVWDEYAVILMVVLITFPC